MRNLLAVFLISLLLASCDSNTPDFFYTQGNLKYQYHDIVEDGKIPAIGDYLTVYIEYKTSEGEVIYSSIGSTFDDTQIIHLGYPAVEGGIEEGFAQLMEGDSVTFYIAAQKFYEYYLFKEVPQEIEAEEEILITLRLLRIETPNEYNARLDQEEEDCDFKEFAAIDSIVSSWKDQGAMVEEVGGIFMVKEATTSTDTISYGRNVGVYYKGYYPNHKVFYNNQSAANPDEFKVGVDGQTIEGLKIALLNMYVGQAAKIVVPSYLGFSAQAIENGQVPPCTPLIFELKIQEE